MSGTLLFLIIIFLTIGTVIAATILFKKAKEIGRDTDTGLAYVRAAWITIAVYSSLLIAGIVYICIETSFWIILLIFVLPLVIVIGLIITLTYGIYYLVSGYRKGNVDKRKVSIGMTCMIINAAIILAIGTLIIIFMSGLIPIKFM